MGGGTSSYREIEETDCVLLWGSNARETHPIFFHHLLKGIRARRAADRDRSAADLVCAVGGLWAGLDVGSDIALSNTIAREIIDAGLANREFIQHATSGFEEYCASVQDWTLERGEEETGVPGRGHPRDRAHVRERRRAR